MRLISVNIPFAGFYNSKWSDLVDSEESQWLEYQAESVESEFPEPLRISESDLAEIMYRNVDYSAAYDRIARDYVEAFDWHCGELFGFSFAAKRKVWSYAEKKHVTHAYRQDSCKMQWDGMSSPREYNFETDRLFVTIPLYILERIRKQVDPAILAAAFKERFTSYDGFISHYANTVPDKPLAEWDHNETGTLLRAALGAEWDDWPIYESMAVGSTDYFDQAVKWTEFDAAVMEKRQELLSDWLESDPDRAKNYLANGGDSFGLVTDDMGIAYRCTLTPDLFEGVAL